MYYIYKMCHTPTGRIYIGQRKLPKGKTPETDSYYGSGTVWRNIYKAHPEECVKTVLEFVESKREVNELEKKYIARYRSVYGELCVNIADGGCGGCGKHSPETIEKIRAAHLGRKLSEETKRKLSEAVSGEKHPFFGKHRSEETKRKMSEARKGEKNHMYGKHLSDETKRKLSEANKGKRLSEEHREKLSISHKGKRLSEETKRKLSISHKGKRFSEEHREKLSKSRTGRKLSEETKRKISESAKNRKKKS